MKEPPFFQIFREKDLFREEFRQLLSRNLNRQDLEDREEICLGGSAVVAWLNTYEFHNAHNGKIRKTTNRRFLMPKMLLHWICSALAVYLTSLFVPGFYVSGLISALIAAVVIGLVNATLGLVLKIITIPFSIITFGIFLLVINGLMLEFASAFVPGFHIRSFGAAFIGAIILSLLNMLLKKLIVPGKE
jgi:putative membrane protein